jgi:hypothetical protein
MGSTPGLGWSSVHRVANLTEDFCGLPQSLWANARITTSNYIRMISFFILFNSLNTNPQLLTALSHEWMNIVWQTTSSLAYLHFLTMLLLTHCHSWLCFIWSLNMSDMSWYFTSQFTYIHSAMKISDVTLNSSFSLLWNCHVSWCRMQIWQIYQFLLWILAKWF